MTHRVRPWPDTNPGHVVMVASVRTVLREDMLTPEQKDRIEGCEVLFQATDEATEAFEAWIRKTARPWVQLAPEPAGDPLPPLSLPPVSLPEEPSPC